MLSDPHFLQASSSGVSSRTLSLDNTAHVPGARIQNTNPKVLDMSNFYVRERSVERRAANGNYVAYACGPINHKRYVNDRIE